MKRLWIILLLVTTLLCFAALLSAVLFPAGITQKKERVMQNQSTFLLNLLGLDIESFIEKTGKRPRCLADIVRVSPNSKNDATYFVISGRAKETLARFATATGDFKYEEHSDYILETNDNSEALIYEKMGVRGDDIVYYYKSGFGVWKLPQNEFKKCLKYGKFPPQINTPIGNRQEK